MTKFEDQYVYESSELNQVQNACRKSEDTEKEDVILIFSNPSTRTEKRVLFVKTHAEVEYQKGFRDKRQMEK